MSGDINIQTTETADIERSISNIQNEALKLNNLLHKEQGLEYNLQQGNILMENDFIGTLRVFFSSSSHTDMLRNRIRVS